MGSLTQLTHFFLKGGGGIFGETEQNTRLFKLIEFTLTYQICALRLLNVYIGMNIFGAKFLNSHCDNEIAPTPVQVLHSCLTHCSVTLCLQPQMSSLHHVLVIKARDFISKLK